MSVMPETAKTPATLRAWARARCGWERATDYAELRAAADAWEAQLERLGAVEKAHRRLQGEDLCSICRIETTNISFHFGYGSEHDGEAVCWSCAGRVVDAALRTKPDAGPETLLALLEVIRAALVAVEDKAALGIGGKGMTHWYVVDELVSRIDETLAAGE